MFSLSLDQKVLYLKKCKVVLRTYSGHRLPVLCKALVTVEVNGQLEFAVSGDKKEQTSSVGSKLAQ